MVTSSLIFLVTSHMRHIWSRGSSFFLAVLCMMAVRKDWGLKKPGSQTEEGRLKSEVQLSVIIQISYQTSQQSVREQETFSLPSSLILRRRSVYQADKPLREA